MQDSWEEVGKGAGGRKRETNGEEETWVSKLKGVHG